MTQNSDKEESKPSPLVELAKGMLKKNLEPLGGLTDDSLGKLFFLVRDMYKIHELKASINYETEPKMITLHAYDDKGTEWHIKTKDTNPLDKLPEYLSIPLYKIEFAKRESK